MQQVRQNLTRAYTHKGYAHRKWVPAELHVPGRVLKSCSFKDEGPRAAGQGFQMAWPQPHAVNGSCDVPPLNHKPPFRACQQGKGPPYCCRSSAKHVSCLCSNCARGSTRGARLAYYNLQELGS